MHAPPLLASIESEEALLGVLLVNNKAFHRVGEYLKPEHFSIEVHGRIYGAIANAISAGKHVDARTLKPVFDKDPALADDGGGIYLGRLCAGVGATDGADSYAQLVYDLAQRRQLIVFGDRLREYASNLDNGVTADEIASRATKKLNSLVKRVNTDLGEWDSGDDTGPIPPRGWLLGNIFCRRYVSSLVAAGGTGKTAMRIAHALSLATGRPLTGDHVFQRCRVLIVSLEDDDTELRRRVRAAVIHHEVTHESVRGWLYLAAPGSRYKLATIDDGAAVASDLVKILVDTIRKRHIDVIILDPFVKTHDVAENDNKSIDFVAQVLARLAIEHDCAIDVPHHVKKGQNEAGDADAGRGAGSFKDAARLVYTLKPMTQEEAKTFGVTEQDRRHLVRLDSAKLNIAPPAAAAKWFRLVGVRIGNGTELYPHGDDVQTVEPWVPLDVWSEISSTIANTILTEIDAGLPDGSRFSDHHLAEGREAYRVVQKYASGLNDTQAKEIIKTWLKSGLLVQDTYRDPHTRKDRKGLRVEHSKRPT